MAFLLCGTVAVAVLVGGSPYWMYNMTVVALFATAAIGLNIMLGYAGQISFTQSAFMAVGGYGSAILGTKLAVDPWLAMIFSAVLAAIGALLIGIPLLRLRGHYFGMASFALALGTPSFLLAAASLTNGPLGIAGVPPLRFAGVSFLDPIPIYLLAWGVCIGAFLVEISLLKSHVGRAWRAISTNQDVARSLGIDARKYKLLTLAIAAVMASLAGSLYVEFQQYVAPDIFDIGLIMTIYLIVYAGGRGSIAGPLVGAVFYIVVPQLIGSLEQFQHLVFSALLIAIIVLRPNGIMGRGRQYAPVERILPLWVQRRLRRDYD
jgi:branched-chain amino acid transport system permease protein